MILFPHLSLNLKLCLPPPTGCCSLARKSASACVRGHVLVVTVSPLGIELGVVSRNLAPVRAAGAAGVCS